MKKEIIVIGAGFSGIAAAASLAKDGHSVTVLEKNISAGGRARVWKERGFTFDMGPSFYWMPDVFERFFDRFGQRPSDHYELKRLDPSYSVVLSPGEQWAVPADRKALTAFFELHEHGAGSQLDRFLTEAKVKYDLGMSELVYRPSLSWWEYAHPGLLLGLLKTKVFRSLRSHVRAHFKHDGLRTLMEFPVLFLGASPQNTPALYSLMNYADMVLGTWYPMGGMGSVVTAMVNVAKEHGVTFKFEQNVEKITTTSGAVSGVVASGRTIAADIVVASADYHHVDQELLDTVDRGYDKKFWDKRTMAPSSLLFYLGLNKKVAGLEHHTLFFDGSLDVHSSEIYDEPAWPSKPLFYVSCPSKTDPSCAPEGMENMFILIPIAPGLLDTEDVRERYYNIIMDRVKEHLGKDLRSFVILKRSYCINDLQHDYNAYRGNAYGMANTLLQTGPLRPRMKSNKVAGLYFTGQLTVPGPGVPPALISGQVVADLVVKDILGSS